MLERQKIGGRLIKFAWCVEIVAATIGVIIAVLVILNTEQQIKDLGGDTGPSLYMGMFLGGLPFIIVAMIELTKIPLAQAAYLSRSIIWRSVFALGLVFLMVITFETLLNGFERNFSQRTYAISKLKKDLLNTQEKITHTETEIASLASQSEINARSKRQVDLDRLDKDRDSELALVDKERQQAHQSYGGTRSIGPKSRLDQITINLKELDEKHERELSQAQDRYSQSISRTDGSVADQRTAIQEQIKILEMKMSEIRAQELAAVRNVSDSKNYDRLLADEISRIESDYDKRISTQRDVIEKEVRRIDGDIEKIDREIEGYKNSIFIEEEKFFALRDEDEINRLRSVIAGSERTRNNLRQSRQALSTDTTVRNLNAEKDDKIAEAQNRIAEQGGAAGKERAAIRQRFQSDVRATDQELKNLRSRFSQLSSENEISSLAQKRDDEIGESNNSYQIGRNKLLAEQSELIEAIAGIENESQAALEPILARLEIRRAAVLERFERKRHEIEQNFASEISEISETKKRIDLLRMERAELDTARIKLRDDISRHAEASQIYRVAQYWFDRESAADVQPSEIKTVSAIWFGSLAAITAWTGTLLAFGGIVLLHTPEETPKPVQSRLARALRAYLIDRRRHRRRPVIKEIQIEVEVVKEVEKEVIVNKTIVQDVIREVPVDKVVFREVPKEIVRKELVYVPFFTDDPSVLKDQLGRQSTEKEVTSRKRSNKREAVE